jgi:dTDP-glucose 4,6-dehydratase
VKNVLVTGGAGFIGSNFVRASLESNPAVKVINLDALTYAGNKENLSDWEGSDRYKFFKGNINDASLIDNLFQDLSIDTVVNFAAETHVDRSIDSAFPFMETNAMGTLCLLECARRAWLGKRPATREKVHFHHISTDEVYGSLNAEDPPFSETTPYRPNSPYAASKAASDHLVRAYANTHGLPITISNCSNNYGAYQYPEKLIPLIILNAIEGRPLPIYGDGLQIRDWLHVEDHCRAIAAILDSGISGETYNVGGDVQITNLDLVKKICAILDEVHPNTTFGPYASLIQFVEDRPGHDRRYAMDNGKIKASVGWAPTFSFDEGIKITVSWYLENMNWVNAIRTKPDFQNWVSKNYGLRGQK